jgi:hypothetical protein
MIDPMAAAAFDLREQDDAEAIAISESAPKQLDLRGRRGYATHCASFSAGPVKS